MKGESYQPAPLWPRRKSLPWRVVVPVLAGLILVADASVAPFLASTMMAQSFADYMSTIIVGLDAAAAAVEFEEEARVILAMDRAMAPLWAILCILSNMRIIQYKVKVHPAWIMIFFAGGITFFLYIYFNPLIPDPDAITRSHQSYYRLMSSGPLGFSIVHGAMSFGLILAVILMLNSIVRLKELLSAHHAWTHGSKDN